MSSVEQTTTDIANLAIGHCGVSKPVGNISTEKSLEAQMCRTFFNIARQEVLRKFPWSFSVKQINPALIANQPTPEWLYAYQYPSDAIRISRFMSWRLSNDTRQSRVEYKIMQPVANTLSTLTPTPAPYPQSTGLWLFTNWPGVNVSFPTIIEYIFDNQNISQWPSDFVLALSYRLATLIVSTITTGDPQNLKDKIMQDYKEIMGDSEAANLNEEQRPEEPQSEFIRSREGDNFNVPGMTWVAEPAGYSVQ